LEFLKRFEAADRRLLLHRRNNDGQRIQHEGMVIDDRKVHCAREQRTFARREPALDCSVLLLVHCTLVHSLLGRTSKRWPHLHCRGSIVRRVLFATVLLLAVVLAYVPGVETGDHAILDAQFRFLRAHASESRWIWCSFYAGARALLPSFGSTNPDSS